MKETYVETVVKFMSHEVTDLEPILEYLQGLDSTDSVIWETRYVCFLWLSLVCMIPFDLKRVDSAEHEQVRKKKNRRKHNLMLGNTGFADQ